MPHCSCRLCLPPLPYWSLHDSKPPTSACHHEPQSLLQHCLVGGSFLEWLCHHTWPPLDQTSWSSGYGIFYMGHWIANCLRSRTGLFNGKSSIPLLSCVCFGDISGLDRSSSSTAKTKQLWVFRLQVHPKTHLSCTWSALYFSVLLLTTLQSLSLILLALIMSLCSLPRHPSLH